MESGTAFILGLIFGLVAGIAFCIIVMGS